MELTITKEQRQVLGEQMHQAMQLLQMNAQELEAYLENLSQENPLLEVKPPQERAERSLGSVPVGYRRREVRTESAEDLELLRPVHNYESLTGSLQEQIAALRVPELMRRELDWLRGELDERGYLPEDPGDLRPFGGSRERYENAVVAFQSLEPAGVGARNLSECLCIQLRRLGVKDELPYRLCESGLERLARGQLNAVAAELGTTVRKVSEAKELIASLSPRPSNGYTDGEDVPYVLPDVEVTQGNAGPEVAAADRYMPTYGVDAFYAEMSRRESLTEEEREYFRAKLAQARWAINCVDRRRSMLLECARAVAERQADFFRDGASPLRPLTMTEVAESLGVHPSTVSRAVKGKYLSCKWGVFPLAGFFVQELSGGENTGRDVLEGVKKLIAAEDPEHPLSDRDIAEALERSGLSVSRRTVAKYREAALIPSAPGRRVRRE